MPPRPSIAASAGLSTRNVPPPNQRTQPAVTTCADNEFHLTARSIPAKTTHTIPLSVRNWLNRPQRFRVAIERGERPASAAADGGADSVRLEGNQMIDVPALSSKDYSVLFYSYVQVRGGRCKF